jgi:hypothetical protein
MHNCKATRERISELLLVEVNDARQDTLSSDLQNCDECRRELDSVKNTLRITARVIETATPPAYYWTAYHAKLKQKLVNSQTQLIEASQPVARTSWLARFVKTSVRVPVPVGIGLLLIFGLSLLLVARVSSEGNIPPPLFSLVRVPVEVPVIKEKSVIRVVYRERDRRRNSKRSERTRNSSGIDSTVATHTLRGSEKPLSLAGFKPPDEIKLTVIKGGSPDEK